MKETWKQIPDYPDYDVSNVGRVRSWRTYRGKEKASSPKMLTGKVDPKGYPRYAVRNKNGVRKTVRVSILVLSAFVGPRPKGMHVCHNDGDPRNNTLNNLRYDTPKANSRDRVRHGTMLYGEDHPLSRFTEDDVLTIRTLYASGKYTQRELGKRFGTAGPVISYIVRGITWQSTGGPISLNNWKPGGKRLAVTKEQLRKNYIEQKRLKKLQKVREIRELYAKGEMSLSQIGKLHNLSESGISRIVNGDLTPEAGGPIKGIDY